MSKTLTEAEIRALLKFEGMEIHDTNWGWDPTRASPFRHVHRYRVHIKKKDDVFFTAAIGTGSSRDAAIQAAWEVYNWRKAQGLAEHELDEALDMKEVTNRST